MQKTYHHARDGESKKKKKKSKCKTLRRYRLAAAHLSMPVTQVLGHHHPECRGTAVHYSCSGSGNRQAPGQEALNTCLENCPSRGILIFIATGMLISQEAADACTDGPHSPSCRLLLLLLPFHPAPITHPAPISIIPYGREYLIARHYNTCSSVKSGSFSSIHLQPRRV